MKLPQLVIFDLDGTLAVSKSPLTHDMWGLLARLLEKTKVAIITGGRYAQFIEQVFSMLPAEADKNNLFIFPTSGASYYRFLQNEWQEIYANRLSSADVSSIKKALLIAQEKAGVITEWPFWWEQAEDRETQVSWSALGQKCPPDVKATWDPEKKKRLAMLPFLEEMLPDFEIHIGGMTTIDITQKGIDKKYGIHKMHEYLGIAYEDMFFIGDAIFPGGNDYAPVEMGIAYQKTEWPEMTMDIITQFLV